MTPNWTRACAFGDLPPDGMLRIEVHGEPVCLYRLADGVYATHDTCTHGQASLADGYIDGDLIECPLHQGSFDIRSGAAVGAPCSVGLACYPVHVESGEVFVGEALPSS